MKVDDRSARTYCFTIRFKSERKGDFRLLTVQGGHLFR
jgi:hypothetical protein